MLTAIDLSHSLPQQISKTPLFDNVNFNVAKGESVAIVGASGSGKTTLLSFLAGLDTPKAGKVLIDGEEVTAMDEEGRAELRAKKVAFVFQNFQLIDGLTALQNVCLPLEVKGHSSPEPIATSWLEKVGLAQRLNNRPTALSGGEQQRVAVARAFACDAPLLFADEPTGSLDVKTGRTIADMLFDLCQQNAQTLVLVTHDEALADRCNRVLRLENGTLSVQK